MSVLMGRCTAGLLGSKMWLKLLKQRAGCLALGIVLLSGLHPILSAAGS